MFKNQKGIGLIPLILIIVLVLVIGTVATILIINKNKDATTDISNNALTSNNNKQSNDKNETVPSDDKQQEILTGGTYKVPGKNIYVDVPNWQEIEKGFTELFILHGIKYVAFTANNNGDTTSLVSAHNSAFEKFKQNIQNYSYVNSLNVTEDKTETINGIEVYKYIGTVNCGRDTVYDTFVIGYSFILDGVPCTITGSVIAEDGKIYQMNGKQLTVDYEEEVIEMTSIVEEMMQTVRTLK